MVILVGGVSCTGKTVMAQKLLEKYKIPYLSIDHIKMGLIRGSIVIFLQLTVIMNLHINYGQ
jgi:adenylate kinase family enzyme